MHVDLTPRQFMRTKIFHGLNFADPILDCKLKRKNPHPRESHGCNCVHAGDNVTVSLARSLVVEPVRYKPRVTV